MSIEDEKIAEDPLGYWNKEVQTYAALLSDRFDESERDLTTIESLSQAIARNARSLEKEAYAQIRIREDAEPRKSIFIIPIPEEGGP